MVFRSPAAPDPARLLKSIVFNRNLKENRWFFDPRPLPTRPGSQKRYFFKGFKRKSAAAPVVRAIVPSGLVQGVSCRAHSSKHIGPGGGKVVGRILHAGSSPASCAEDMRLRNDVRNSCLEMSCGTCGRMHTMSTSLLGSATSYLRLPKNSKLNSVP